MRQANKIAFKSSEHSRAVTNLSWSPDGSDLASGSAEEPNVFIWSKKNGSTYRNQIKTLSVGSPFAWSPKKRNVLAVASNRSLKM